MSDKNVQEVLIDGRIYQLGGYESQEYLQKVGVYINNLLDQMKEMDSWRKLSGDERHVLTQINIADDYFKAQDRIIQLEDEALSKEKELYELKHQLASLRVQFDEQESQLAKKNQELAAAARTIQEQTDYLTRQTAGAKRADKKAGNKGKSAGANKSASDKKQEDKKRDQTAVSGDRTKAAGRQELDQDRSLDAIQMSFDDLTINANAGMPDGEAEVRKNNE